MCDRSDLHTTQSEFRAVAIQKSEMQTNRLIPQFINARSSIEDDVESDLNDSDVEVLFESRFLMSC